MWVGDSLGAHSVRGVTARCWATGLTVEGCLHGSIEVLFTKATMALLSYTGTVARAPLAPMPCLACRCCSTTTQSAPCC